MKIAGTPIRTFEGYLLAFMVLVDLLFLALSLTHHYGNVLEDRRYSINGHGGYGEFWQYAKELVCFLMLINAALRCRQPLLMAWAILFLYLLLTDVFRINNLIAGWISASSWLDAGGLGISRWQLKRVVVTLFGGALLLAVLLYHRRAGQSSLREDSRGLGCLLLIFLLFGVLMDFLNRSLTNANLTFYNLASVIEEWGEMLVMSLLVLGTYLMFVRALRNHAKAPVKRRLRTRSRRRTHAGDVA